MLSSNHYKQGNAPFRCHDSLPCISNTPCRSGAGTAVGHRASVPLFKAPIHCIEGLSKGGRYAAVSGAFTAQHRRPGKRKSQRSRKWRHLVQCGPMTVAAVIDRSLQVIGTSPEVPWPLSGLDDPIWGVLFGKELKMAVEDNIDARDSIRLPQLDVCVRKYADFIRLSYLVLPI